MREAILCAQADVEVPMETAREWFLSLEEHPERYRFDTHEGFEFLEGGFGEVGARFRTRERFLFLKLELVFKLAEVDERAFSFWLARPSCIGVWGRFEIEKGSAGHSRVSLHIGSETRLGQLLLRFFPVATAIHRQICEEVRHIKQSMEAAGAARSLSA